MITARWEGRYAVLSTKRVSVRLDPGEVDILVFALKTGTPSGFDYPRPSTLSVGIYVICTVAKDAAGNSVVSIARVKNCSSVGFSPMYTAGEKVTLTPAQQDALVSQLHGRRTR